MRKAKRKWKLSNWLIVFGLALAYAGLASLAISVWQVASAPVQVLEKPGEGTRYEGEFMSIPGSVADLTAREAQETAPDLDAPAEDAAAPGRETSIPAGPAAAAAAPPAPAADAAQAAAPEPEAQSTAEEVQGMQMYLPLAANLGRTLDTALTATEQAEAGAAAAAAQDAAAQTAAEQAAAHQAAAAPEAAPPAEAASAGSQPAAQEPQPAPRPPAAPHRLVIPSIRLDAPVVPAETQLIKAGKKRVQHWLSPNYFAGGWHENSARLGEPGNTVINGHHNIHGEVFVNLVHIREGDLIAVYPADSEHPFMYVVTNVLLVPEKYEQLSTRMSNAQWILPSPDERLTLVTCWPYESNTHRVIVVAVPYR